MMGLSSKVTVLDIVLLSNRDSANNKLFVLYLKIFTKSLEKYFFVQAKSINVTYFYSTFYHILQWY